MELFCFGGKRKWKSFGLEGNRQWNSSGFVAKQEVELSYFRGDRKWNSLDFGDRKSRTVV